jgi:hypothetical protein
VAEGGGLLNRYTLQRRIEGSNPSVSASSESLASLCTEINSFEPAIALFDVRCPSIGRRAEPGKVVGAGHLDLRVESQCSRKPLIKTKEIVRQTGSNEVVLGDHGCVFFTQHSPEKCAQSLWEGRFFIAWRGPSVNVTKRRRGASPCCAVRAATALQGAKVSRASGEQGEVPTGAVALGGYGTLSKETFFGGSR